MLLYHILELSIPFYIIDELLKIDQELKEINGKIIKLKKRQTELLERKEKLKQLSYQEQTNSISDENKWAHTGISHKYKHFPI